MASTSTYMYARGDFNQRALVSPPITPIEECQRHHSDSPGGHDSPWTFQRPVSNSSLDLIEPHSQSEPASRQDSADPRVISRASASRKLKEWRVFPWKSQIDYMKRDLRCNGRVMLPDLCVRLDKGFSLEGSRDMPLDKYWTSYRRNYFSIQLSLSIDSDLISGPLLYRGRQIQALGYRLSAAHFIRGVEKQVELVQYGPKREKVSMSAPQIKIISLPPAPYTSLAGSDRYVSQGLADSYRRQLASTLSYDNTSHVFERIQFKRATANNGKRRA